MGLLQNVSSSVLRILYLSPNEGNLVHVRLFSHIMLFDKKKIVIILKEDKYKPLWFKDFFSYMYMYLISLQYLCNALLHLTLQHRVKT